MMQLQIIHLEIQIFLTHPQAVLCASRGQTTFLRSPACFSFARRAIKCKVWSLKQKWFSGGHLKRPVILFISSVPGLGALELKSNVCLWHVKKMASQGKVGGAVYFSVVTRKSKEWDVFTLHLWRGIRELRELYGTK